MKTKTTFGAGIVRKIAHVASVALVAGFAQFALASEILIEQNTTWTADDVARLDPGDTISIAAGAELTFDLTGVTTPVEVPQAITGKGGIKQKGDSSELILSGVNSFAGGFYTASNGSIVRARTATALGTGSVTTDGTRSYVVLETGTATFANTFKLARTYLVLNPTAAATTITVSGPIFGRDGTRMFISTSLKDEHPTFGNCRFVFENTITAKSGENKSDIVLCGYLPTPRIDFNGKITARTVRNNNMGGDDWEGKGPCSANCYFNTENDVDMFVPYWGTYYPTVTGAFPETCRISSADTRKDTYRHSSNVDFLGLSITVGSLELVDPVGVGSIKSTESYGYLKSASPATLTVAGGGTYVTDANFRDQLSFDWNPPTDDDTIIISNRLHSTSGKFTVSKGEVYLVGDSSAENLSEVAVGQGARFLLDTTRANALKSLSRLTVEESGSFEIAAGTTPLSGSTIAYLDDGAKIKLGKGVQALFSLVMTNGVPVANGAYETGADWLELGDGASLAVNTGNLPANTWIKGSDGNWTEATGWSKGEKPSSSYATALTLPGASYAVTVDSDAGSIGQLTVSNDQADQTATLNINSALTVGDGARAHIGAGGVVNVGNEGVLKAMPGNSTSAITVAAGGALGVSGNGEVQVSAYTWGGNSLVVEKGGTLDVSGDAVIGLADGGTAVRIFGDGAMTFRGNSTFGRAATGASPGWTWKFAAGSGAATGTVEFLDHATFLDTSAGLYFDRGSGLTARLLLHSDSTSHAFAWQTILGGVGARGEIEITDGKLTVSGQGLWLGGVQSRGTAVADAVSEGVLRVAGTAVVTMANNNDATGQFNGLLVGDCSRATKIPGSDAYYQDTRLGTVVLSDNASIKFGAAMPEIMLGIGSTNAIGRFTQSGGEIGGTATGNFGDVVIGMGGGQGEWTMTGGLAEIPFDVFVGGATLSDIGKTVETLTNYAGTDADHVGKAKGLLKLLGGEFRVGRADGSARDLVLSGDGVGTLYLGQDAKLSVTGNLVAKEGSKLVVDMRGCTDRRKKLAVFGGTTSAFAAENVEFLTDQDPEIKYKLVITDTAITATRVSGFAITIR